MINNPIKVVRESQRNTLEEFSIKCGIHIQALYLNELGVYPHILPSIMRYISTLSNLSRDELNSTYREFQKKRRRTHGELHRLKVIDLGEPIFDEGHPFIRLREQLGMSRMAFCKSFCVQPSLMYRLENTLSKNLPEQLREALTEAGMPAILLKELSDRCEEYLNGVVLSPD